MVDLETQLGLRQCTCVGGITEHHRLGSDLGRFRIGGSEQYEQSLRAVLLGEALDHLLALQVHCTRGRSDEALGRCEYDLACRRLDARSDCGSGDAVAFAEDDRQFVSQQ